MYTIKVPILCLIGSCTACVVSLHRRDKKLYTANLGDSGFRVIRQGQVVHRSQEQQHYFNSPYQLSVAPSQYQGLVISDRYVLNMLLTQECYRTLNMMMLQFFISTNITFLMFYIVAHKQKPCIQHISFLYIRFIS